MLAPEQVEMRCIRERGQLRVVVESAGPYRGFYVQCSKRARKLNQRYRAWVRQIDRWDADRSFCMVIDPNTWTQDFEALEPIR